MAPEARNSRGAQPHDFYYTERPTSASEPARIALRFAGAELPFMTDHGVFARQGLDTGSELLVEAVLERIRERGSLENHSDFLDLGCGYGPVGILVGKQIPELRLYFSDVNERALDLTRENLRLNGLRGEVRQGPGLEPWQPQRFDWIALNPPIRIGKEAVFGLYAECRAQLAEGGRLLCVVGKKQGAPSHQKELERLFGTTRKVKRGRGFVVFECGD